MSTFEYRPGPAIRVTRLNYLGLYRSTVSVIILLESQVSKEKGFSQTKLSKLPDIPRICQHLCNLPVRLHRYSRWYDRFGPMWSGACLSQALVGGAAFFPRQDQIMYGLIDCVGCHANSFIRQDAYSFRH